MSQSGDPNVIIKNFMNTKKIIAPPKIDPHTGQEILEPEGYDDIELKEQSMWFMVTN